MSLHVSFVVVLATGTRYRAMSPGRVVEYFRYLKSFGYESTYIIDDCFAADQNWGKEVCRALINDKNEIKFSVQTRVDVVLDNHLVELMKRAGCVMIGLGIESYNNDLLKKMEKKLACEMIDEALNNCHFNDIDVTAFLQLGLPGEDQHHRSYTEFFLQKMFKDEKIFASGPFLSCPYVGSIGWEKSKDSYPYFTVLESMLRAGLGDKDINDVYSSRKMFINYDLGESVFKDVPGPTTHSKVWSRPASILQQIQQYRPDVFSQWWKYITHIGWNDKLRDFF